MISNLSDKWGASTIILINRTPGHPEANHGIDGLEVTTGPLGQGISNAVGLAMGAAHFSATFNRPGYEIFNNFTFCVLGDGCLQEGVAAEAAALAGHLKLGKLIALYDDNHISIDGDTALGFTEDVCKRFESYGWHTLVVTDGDNDLTGLAEAVEKAKAVTDKPTLIKIRTTIGFGSKNQGEEKVHGAPLGKDDLAQTKTKLGFNPEEFFVVPKEVSDFWKSITAKNAEVDAAWSSLYKKYTAEFPDLVLLYFKHRQAKLKEDSITNYQRISVNYFQFIVLPMLPSQLENCRSMC
jgi:transketolase